ncbi:MAG: hypothetical protein U0V64_05595 [Cyclobacteriaceae bacterium]
MKKYIIALFVSALSLCAMAQSKADSVVIRVGERSQVIISIKDKRDLQTLKHYNFQALIEDMIHKVESRDTTPLSAPSSSYRKDTVRTSESVVDNRLSEQEESDRWKNHNDRGDWRRQRHTRSSVNFDLGTNNYLSNGKFPDSGTDQYAVRPLGSWYLAVNDIQRTRIGKNGFIEWGFGVSWYNFKFQDDKTLVTRDAAGVHFAADTRDVDFRKSKLTAVFLNASIVPMLDFGGSSWKPSIFDGHRNSQFRIGVGPYAGYRIDSYSKLMFKQDGDRHRERDHDNFALNNLRYGLRLQVGFRGTDLFFNYDMNELFTANKGPKLNAFSFGVSF